MLIPDPPVIMKLGDIKDGVTERRVAENNRKLVATENGMYI